MGVRLPHSTKGNKMLIPVDCEKLQIYSITCTTTTKTLCREIHSKTLQIIKEEF